MPKIEHDGEIFEVDEEGFLINFVDWSKNWANHVQEFEGIDELTGEHWKVINALQSYYKEKGKAPVVRVISKIVGFKLKKIYELFPSGPTKGACKMAGIPKPKPEPAPAPTLKF